ncbi:reverse transcriptase domain-containing protein [Tanacetum coccineum]
MAGRSTRSNTANNTNPPNKTADEVARQLNTAFLNLLTQLIQALRGNRANQRDVTQRCCEYGQQPDHRWNKRKRTRGNFALTAPEQGQGQHQYVGQHSKYAKCNFHHSGNCPVCGRCNQVGHFTRYCTSRATNKRPIPTCFECGDPNHFRRNCPRMNRATTSRGNRPNPVLAIEGNTNQGNNRNRAQGRAFGLGVAEAPQDPNVVTGTFSLNDHFATLLFDFGADYSFISTNFLPLINMKPSVISLGYEIEIASDVKVETNKIIRGGRLELEGHTFIIDLIPFGYPWEDFKKLLMEEYCPDDEVQKLESEFWNHKMVGSDINGYTTSFHELARLVPHMVTPESQRVNRYIRGLAPEIKEHVTSSKPATIQGAVSMANSLITDGIKDGLFKKKENARHKWWSNDQNKNRGRGDRNKRQRTGGNFALTALEQGQGKR